MGYNLEPYHSQIARVNALKNTPRNEGIPKVSSQIKPAKVAHKTPIDLPAGLQTQNDRLLARASFGCSLSHLRDFLPLLRINPTAKTRQRGMVRTKWRARAYAGPSQAIVLAKPRRFRSELSQAFASRTVAAQKRAFATNRASRTSPVQKRAPALAEPCRPRTCKPQALSSCCCRQSARRESTGPSDSRWRCARFRAPRCGAAD